MTLEEAIKTAIDYETKVRDTYLEAVGSTTDEKGKRIFKVLADEEQGHLDYLESRLQEWQQGGTLTPEALKTVVPSREVIQKGIRTVQESMEKRAGSHVAELDMLKKALAAEIETGNFYKRMVSELDSTGQQLFEQFLAIEEGHQTVVQAEIDSLSGFGFWLDFREFSPEAG